MIRHGSGFTSQRECRQGAGQPLVQMQESPGSHAAPCLSSRLGIVFQVLPLHLCKGEQPVALLLLCIKHSLAPQGTNQLVSQQMYPRNSLQGSSLQQGTFYSNAGIKECH